MVTYYYPSVGTSGYRWNMLQRIFNAIGLEPIGSGDVNNQTYLQFGRELTVAEKNSVDAIMADNPTYPPTTTNSRAFVPDLWNRKDHYANVFQLPYDLYYTESVLGSGDIDRIEIHFKKVLTTQERNRVRNEYSNSVGFI